MKLKIELKTTKTQARKFIRMMENQGYVAVTDLLGQSTYFTLDGKISIDYEVFIPPDPYARAFVSVRPA